MTLTPKQREMFLNTLTDKLSEQDKEQVIRSQQDNHKTERIRTQNEISKLRTEIKRFKPSDVLKWLAISLLIAEALGLLTISDIELLRVILNFI